MGEKNVSAHGIGYDGQGGLVVPARDAGGNLRSLQFINRHGGERMLTGDVESGSMHMIDPNKEASSGPIIVAEGYASAASLHEATGRPVACAFDARNFKPVAEALREKYPEAGIVIAADDNLAKGRSASLDRGREAAEAVGGEFVAPRFTKAHRVGWTRAPAESFNDLARVRGKAAVGEALAPTLQRVEEKREEAEAEREWAVENAGGRAEETIDRIMDRGERIMAEMEQTDMGKLDEALQIRRAEQILREREAREKEQEREQQRAEKLSRGRSRSRERDSGMEM